MARNEGEARAMLRMRYDSAPGEMMGNESGLWMAAERWCRDSPAEAHDAEPAAEGVTLVITHANGLHKEVCRQASVLSDHPILIEADVVSYPESLTWSKPSSRVDLWKLPGPIHSNR